MRDLPHGSASSFSQKHATTLLQEIATQKNKPWQTNVPCCRRRHQERNVSLGEVSEAEQKLLESFDQPLLQHVYETLKMVEKAKEEHGEFKRKCKRERFMALVNRHFLRNDMIKKIQELEKEKGGNEERENTLAGMRMVLEKIEEKLSP